ncbi:sugar phosphate nucleotidyltransferase [Nonomuraea wenchangensis]|uniref:Nucleotidyl transferase n=1 Tax=Nonomuraea wenchangensis TaxID=568860 RepID=A0A1I0LHE0_9ACTN|nr:sugar phosphate nucleotidyltransferase [Nonomuraea wenchangensis]SEU39517.1 Nucleotidyl transferase [Nonomuraea wenchangensis]
MHVVILAGGKGVRLRPYTSALPKPLVPIGEEYAILDIILRQLTSQGFTRATLAVGHLSPLIRAFVGDGSRWGLEVDYTEEVTPLSTIGPLFPIRDRLPEHFLVMNGDVLTTLNYAELLSRHVEAGAPLTVATSPRVVKIDFGVLETSGGHITGFREKPLLSYLVSMGVYALSRDTIAHYPEGMPFGFDELVLDLLAHGRQPGCFEFDGYWLDIGRPDDYDEANARFEEIRSLLLPTDRERVR